MSTATADNPKTSQVIPGKGRARRVGRRVVKNERGGLFRLEVGVHVGDVRAGCNCDGCAMGNGHVYEAYDAYLARMRVDNRGKDARLKDSGWVEPQSRAEYDNDLVPGLATDAEGAVREVDLASRFGDKFSRADQSGVGPILAVQRAKRLEDLSNLQLLALAEDEKVQVKDGAKRDEVIKALRAAGKG